MFIRLAVLVLVGAWGYALLDYDRRRPPTAEDGPTNEFERRLLALEAPSLPGAEAFQSALGTMLEAARAAGTSFLDVSASTLSERVAGDGSNPRISDQSCAAMRSAMSRGDMLLREPRTGVGPTLTVRYFL